MQSVAAGRTRVVDALQRPLVAAVVVLGVYALVAMLNSTGGYLGTDTGAKVITLDRMVENDTASPDVGYWAEEWDPDGDYHPLFDTVPNSDGEWVNVTTLPMLLASKPLYDLGGYRLALAFPMVGGLLASFASRDIARRLGGDRAGWWSFWVTALASPVAIYALDFWEHALGAGLMLGAVASLLRIVDGERLWFPALVAGLALGASATMRAESLVVAFVSVGATCGLLMARRQVGRSLGTGALAVAGFALPWFVNAALETDVGGNSRTSRVTGEAQREWWTELGERSEEALVTWLGLPGADFPANVVFGALIVGLLVGAVVLGRRGEQRAPVLLLLAGVMYLLVLASGLGFVPGALVASPFASVAILVRGTTTRRFVLVIALLMTVLTWMFQLTGGAGPQWGGRYLLVPSLLLTVLGVVALVERDGTRQARSAIAACAIGVTAFGAVWLNQRSHDVESFFDDLAARPEDVIISANGFLVREAGPAYEDRLYLSIGRRGDIEGAVEVVEQAGLTTFGLLTRRDAPGALDAELVGSDRVEFLGVPLWYHRYVVD